MANTAPGTSTTTDEDDKKQTPPWGEDFDAEKAWRLVQNLRSDKETLTTERDELKTKLTAAESTSSEAEGKLKAAEEARDGLQRELYVAKALKAHPDLEGYEEFLTGDTEEAILERAARLSKIGAKDDGGKPKDGADGGKDGDEDDEDDDSLPGRPEPKLRPGHGGDEPEAVDIDEIVKGARASTF